MIRNSVVLPQPDGPSSEKNSPARIERLTFDSASTVPNRRTIFSTSTAGASFPKAGGVTSGEMGSWAEGVCTGRGLANEAGKTNQILNLQVGRAGDMAVRKILFSHRLNAILLLEAPKA